MQCHVMSCNVMSCHVMHVCMYVCTYVCMHACNVCNVCNSCMYVCMYVCVYVCMHSCTCMYIYFFNSYIYIYLIHCTKLCETRLSQGLTTSMMPARSAMTFALVSLRWIGMPTSSLNSQAECGTRLMHNREVGSGSNSEIPAPKGFESL